MDVLEEFEALAIDQPGDNERTRHLAIAVATLLLINRSDRERHRDVTEAIHDHWTRDYHKLRHENIQLRDEIYQLRQQLPTIEQIELSQVTQRAD